MLKIYVTDIRQEHAFPPLAARYGNFCDKKSARSK